MIKLQQKLKKFFLLVTISFCIFYDVYAAEVKVVPVGKTAGIRIYTDGLLVIGTSEISGENIAEKYGIEINDRIKKINGETAESSQQLSRILNENPQGILLSIARNNETYETTVVPKQGDDGIYRLGLWVRDSTAGIGTVTYYNPASNTFAALGHAINDVDTGNILTVKSGDILTCDIISVTKSTRGNPGALNGSVDGNDLGDVTLNTQTGIFGTVSNSEFFNCFEAIPVAAKSQIHEGEAVIISDAFDNGQTEYSVNIKKITNEKDKELVIEVTDQRLIDITGGIVQGMSGSPIIQDGRLVGAVTHVFVNSPLNGYGTLAENMIDVSQNING